MDFLIESGSDVYKIGYALINSPADDFRPQLNVLEDCGCQKIYQDIAVSFKSERPGLSDLIMELSNNKHVEIYCESFFSIFKTVDTFLPLADLVIEKEAKVILLTEGITVSIESINMISVWYDLMNFKVNHRARRRAKPNKKIKKNGT
ncbi:MAG: recombinase family protein [Cyclobacteriaceae bacterium]